MLVQEVWRHGKGRLSAVTLYSGHHLPGLSDCYRLFLPHRAHSWWGDGHLAIYKDNAGWSLVTAPGKASVIHSADIGQGPLPHALRTLRVRHGPCSEQLDVLGKHKLQLCKE